MSPSFKIWHRKQKTTTLSNLPEGVNSFKDRVKCQLQLAELQGGLCLPINKRKAVIDFVSAFPQTSASALTPSNISHGFYENGMLSSESPTKCAVPSFRNVLATCTATMPEEVVDLCEQHLSRLASEVSEHGHVPERAFNELKFPIDIDPEGNKVPKHQSISEEHRQRAKCLTHQHQVELRQARVEQAQQALSKHLAVKVDKCHNLMAHNHYG